MNEFTGKTIFFLIILACASVAGAQVGLYPTDQSTLRILDINVWSGLDYEGYLKMGEYEPDSVREKRYQALVSQIRQLDPDIIGVHEANKLPRYARRLARDTGYEAFWHVGVGGVRLGRVGLPWNLREGDMILAKPELDPQFAGRKQLSGGYVGKWATFHLSDATQVIAIRITFQDQPVYIFATHWHASWSDAPYMLEKAEELRNTGGITEEEYQSIQRQIKEGVEWRLSESEQTIEFIRETAKEHDFILMGDFNSESESQEIRNLIQSGMVDLFQHAHPGKAGFTWDPATNLNQQEHYLKASSEEKEANAYTGFENFSRGIPKRIDYIFMGSSSGMADERVVIRSARVVMKEVIDGVQASDHYGIFAEIALFNSCKLNQAGSQVADKPLFRDPVHDGAADPVLVWNSDLEKHVIYYTNRRADVLDEAGVRWVHGTRIGMAVSADGGATWEYLDTCNIRYRPDPDPTYWAPDVLEHEGTYHMYLTYVPGVFEDWGHPRHLIHLTSMDGINWDFQSKLDFSNEKILDATVHPLPGGGWRMWYNNEMDKKSMYYADSEDLYNWSARGKAHDIQRGEGAKVFAWKGTWWMFTDEWRGLGVYRSDDLLTWERQKQNILSEPGTGVDDCVMGQHCDVVVNGERAFVFYFTHPGRTADAAEGDAYEFQRSSIQVAELIYNEGTVECDRNLPVRIDLRKNNQGVID